MHAVPGTQGLLPFKAAPLVSRRKKSSRLLFYPNHQPQAPAPRFNIEPKPSSKGTIWLYVNKKCLLNTGSIKRLKKRTSMFADGKYNCL